MTSEGCHERLNSARSLHIDVETGVWKGVEHLVESGDGFTVNGGLAQLNQGEHGDDAVVVVGDPGKNRIVHGDEMAIPGHLDVGLQMSDSTIHCMGERSNGVLLAKVLRKLSTTAMRHGDESRVEEGEVTCTHGPILPLVASLCGAARLLRICIADALGTSCRDPPVMSTMPPSRSCGNRGADVSPCHVAWQDGRLRTRMPHHQKHPSRPRRPTTQICLHHNVR